jgi:hypothetical protein
MKSALAARLAELYAAPPTVATALAAIYQPLFPDTVLAAVPATLLSQHPEPLAAFLRGGCDLHAAASDVLYADGEYACNRRAEDPLAAMIEAAWPPSAERAAVLVAVEDRLRAAWQRALLGNSAPREAAARAQAQRNVAYLLGSGSGSGSGRADGGDSRGGDALEIAMLGVLEAAGAVSSRYFSAAEARALAGILARHCAAAPTVAQCGAAIVSELTPAHAAKLRKIGFRC